jgi:error-prone DNA polymerase
VLPVDVNRSEWECTMEEEERRHEGTEAQRHEGKSAVRLGLRMVSGLGKPEGERVASAVRERGAFKSMLALWRASGARAPTMRRLASADAFGSMGLSRQQALWQARLLRDERLPLFEEQGAGREEGRGGGDGLDRLPAVTPLRQVVLDYDATGVSLRAHPVSFARERLRGLGALECAALKDAARTPEGEVVRVAGLVLVRQRPGTASGVTFMTIEDETGIANLVVWLRTYEKFRRAAASRMLIAAGRVQRAGEVVHVVVTSLRGLDDAVGPLRVGSRNFH